MSGQTKRTKYVVRNKERKKKVVYKCPKCGTRSAVHGDFYVCEDVVNCNFIEPFPRKLGGAKD